MRENCYIKDLFEETFFDKFLSSIVKGEHKNIYYTFSRLRQSLITKLCENQMFLSDNVISDCLPLNKSEILDFETFKNDIFDINNRKILYAYSNLLKRRRKIKNKYEDEHIIQKYKNIIVDIIKIILQIEISRYNKTICLKQISGEETIINIGRIRANIVLDICKCIYSINDALLKRLKKYRLKNNDIAMYIVKSVIEPDSTDENKNKNVERVIELDSTDKNEIIKNLLKEDKKSKKNTNRALSKEYDYYKSQIMYIRAKMREFLLLEYEDREYFFQSQDIDDVELLNYLSRVSKKDFNKKTGDVVMAIMYSEYNCITKKEKQNLRKQISRGKEERLGKKYLKNCIFSKIDNNIYRILNEDVYTEEDKANIFKNLKNYAQKF